nr:aminodeoxychorismate lyase [Aidingimonas lacisalsi]
MSLPLDDRGLAYGDGLFETLLVRDGVPVLWEAHLARLERGCHRLGIPMPEPSTLASVPGRTGSGLNVLKLIVTRGSGGRGYSPPGVPEPRWRWQSAPFAPQTSYWREGVRVRLCDWRLSLQPALAGLKHLNRLENVMARREWSDVSIAEGLVCDTQDRLVEATSMNVFWRLAGRLETPGLDEAGVAGTLREALLAEHAITEVQREPAALLQAEAVWLGNSVQGLWPVIQLDSSDGHVLRQWSLSATHRHLQASAHALLGYPSPSVSAL